MKMKTIIILAILIPTTYILGVLIYASATKYKPFDVTYLDKTNARSPFMVEDSTFSIVTWNIGYGGLGAESDFFYDGGKMVRPSETQSNIYLKGIKDALVSFNADFYCLQEVDLESKRSYGINQFLEISDQLTAHECYHGKNYDVKFVPLPIFKPLGKVKSGLANFSALPTTYPERISYDSETSFPNSLFMLKRCFLKMHIPLYTGKDLVIINTHNSAYDSTGEMKKTELDELMPYVYDLYKQGHYVIVAGDWNQCPPEYKTKGKETQYGEIKFDEDFLQNGWKWSADLTVPTNRKLDQPYSKNESYTTVIDYFLISPNISEIEIKTINQDFKFSDHQPVRLEFKLNP